MGKQIFHTFVLTPNMLSDDDLCPTSPTYKDNEIMWSATSPSDSPAYHPPSPSPSPRAEALTKKRPAEETLIEESTVKKAKICNDPELHDLNENDRSLKSQMDALDKLMDFIMADINEMEKKRPESRCCCWDKTEEEDVCNDPELHDLNKQLDTFETEMEKLTDKQSEVGKLIDKIWDEERQITCECYV